MNGFDGDDAWFDTTGSLLDPDVLENPDSVSVAIRAGDNVNARHPKREKSNATPLHAAASFGYWRSAELLIAAGADVNARDNQGWTPLHYCGSAEMARTLLAHGADWTLANNRGRTAMELMRQPPQEAAELAIAEAIEQWVKTREARDRLSQDLHDSDSDTKGPGL